jgi:hypothetical protein
MEQNENNIPTVPTVKGWEITVYWHTGYEGFPAHWQWNAVMLPSSPSYSGARRTFSLGNYNLREALNFIMENGDSDARADARMIKTFWEGDWGPSEDPVAR